MNNLIIHKIVIYLKKPRIAKLFFFFSDYRRLINSSNYHFDDLYDLYGNKEWYKICNNLKLLQSILRLKVPFINPTDAMNNAVILGNLEIVKWLHENKEGCTTYAMNLAAEHGHLGIVKWLHESGSMCTTYAMNWAAHNGHLEVVKWLHLNRNEGCTTNAMDWAAENGHLEIIKWLHKSGGMCTTLAMDLAAANGHLEIVKWLHQNRNEGCTTDAMNIAIVHGHLETVKFLYQSFESCRQFSLNRNEGRYSHWAMDQAARKNHFEVIMWLEGTNWAMNDD